MNIIIGKVSVRDKNVGIPNLLVSLYDLDPASKPEKITSLKRAIRDPQLWDKIPGDRIGSVLTNSEGKFDLQYEDSEFQVRSREYRPDLIVIVTAPECSDEGDCPNVLHISCGTRSNAGLTESFSIVISEEQLQEAGIPVPGSLDEDPISVIKKINDQFQQDKKLSDAQRKIAEKKIELRREQKKEVDKKLQNFYKMLSTVSDEQKKKLNFVNPGESVEKKNMEVMQTGIKNVVNNPQNRAPVHRYLLLNKEQRKKLEESAEDNGNISESVLNNIISGNSGGKLFPTILIRQDPLSHYCRDKSEEENCAEIALGLNEESNDENNNNGNATDSAEDSNVIGNGIDPISIEEEIPVYVAKLLEKVSAPEDPVAISSTNQKGRADLSTIQKNINDLSLRSGPADVASYHDFPQLQVAFESVWQEAIDQNVTNIASDLYHRFVELGIDPEETFTENGICQDVNETIQGDNPDINVIQAFGVSWEQWNALAQGERLVLTLIALAALRLDLPNEERRFHQQNGLRFLEYATSKHIAGSGEYDRLHELLKDLNNRLKSNYSFTSYAANCREHGINFGILLTYRQKWEPITYQVGELVKTMTLTPKEVRKFSKKIVQKKKRAEKEVEKSLISQREEASQKSSAESQIMRKAQSKTNFSLTAEGTFDIGIYDGTATTNFSKEAQKSSEDMKKNFRESVIKSVHEYKQERNVEVNTEESELIETVESGEIVNPNDELSVTFLFYELQRRYCISEHLHKAMPVIFVAHELPKPEQIDEAWVTLHGWIIRRASLDDIIVLPALTYLSDHVVGEEVALKELRKNVEQQRRIVEEIRNEFAVVKERANFLNKALELAIFQKVGLIPRPESESQEDNEGGASIPLIGNVPIIGDAVEAVADAVGFGAQAVASTVEAIGNLFDRSDNGSRDRYDAAKDIADQSTKRVSEMRRILEHEENVLNSMTEKYTKQLSKHLNQRTKISTLLGHIKENIIHYMKAIWLHESIDQRRCRLRNVKVPVFDGEITYTIDEPPVGGQRNFTGIFVDPSLIPTMSTAEPTIEPEFEYTTLEQVADLDNLLGFMCNYMVFPLKESNILTDFMLEPYRDPIFELRDPDERGNINLSDFAKLVCCIKEKHPKKLEDEEFKNRLKEQYEELKNSYQSNCEEIVVATDSLYIDAYPSEHSLVEDFKLLHRAVDVKKVQAEVREMELDNIRQAARILNSNLEDPDIEKKIVIEGNSNSVVLPEGD